MINVYYDGKCSLCSKEIQYYKSISDINTFKWYDIASEPLYLSTINVTQKDALLYLHATDHKGDLKIGVDAFIIIWKELRFWKYLGFFISLPLIKQITIFIYKIFANYRFSKLEMERILESINFSFIEVVKTSSGLYIFAKK